VIIKQLRYDTMYFCDVVWYSSIDAPQVPCNSKGQHLFRLLVFIGFISRSNTGLEWTYKLL